MDDQVDRGDVQSGRRDGAETTPRRDDDLARPSDPAHRLSERGWIIEPTESGGVRMRTGAAGRGCTLGCSFGLLLLLGLFASFMYFVGVRLWEGVPDDVIAQVFLALILLAIVGTIANMSSGSATSV